MKLLRFALLILLYPLLLSANPPPPVEQPPYEPDSGQLIVHCGVLIDGIAAEPLRDVEVRVERGRIVEVGQGIEVAAELPRLDLSGYTCLPGLIDMHTHIMETPDSTADLREVYDHTLEATLQTGIEMARITLDAGFTSTRNVGTYYGFAARELRQRIEAGEVAGPRLQIAGFYLTVPGGGGDLLIPGVPEAEIPAHIRLGVARGPEAFAERARRAIAGGADVIKLIASGAVLAFGGVPGAPEMTPEEIAAAVAVAHEAGIPVTAHAHGAQSIKDAILGGVDSIEHASLIDDEGIRLALRHNVALSMDVYNGDWIAVEGRRAGWPEEFLRKNDETTLMQRQNFRRAHEAGVTIVFGSDSAVYPHGLNGRQFAYMVQWGMTPMEAIQAATSKAARVLGWADRVGAIRPGRYADLVAVAGNPLDDIRVLEAVDVVIKGGQVFKAPAGLVAGGEAVQ
ncbi:metal-dependent hydrolase family protein [Elongatibacter sediminis]|uniref:Amidohydrolase family protein n=1 Tax=Elongatibacter sediminis TaxID=3119006 RepID=A0AAW9RGM8_9GAMM